MRRAAWIGVVVASIAAVVWLAAGMWRGSPMPGEPVARSQVAEVFLEPIPKEEEEEIERATRQLEREFRYDQTERERIRVLVAKIGGEHDGNLNFDAKPSYLELARLGGGATPFLIRQLADTNTNARLASIEMLIAITMESRKKKGVTRFGPEDVPPWARSLGSTFARSLKDKNADVRWLAAVACIRIYGDDGAKAAAHLFTTEKKRATLIGLGSLLKNYRKENLVPRDILKEIESNGIFSD